MDEVNFNWKFKDLKRAAHCRDCSRRYIREHYKHNRDYYLSKAKARNLTIWRMATEYVGNYLCTHFCVDCGEKDVLVLEFDHRDRSKKSLDVSKIMKNRLTYGKLLKEISKCDVRCANCHRRKTAFETNSWKLKYAPVA